MLTRVTAIYYLVGASYMFLICFILCNAIIIAVKEFEVLNMNFYV